MQIFIKIFSKALWILRRHIIPTNIAVIRRFSPKKSLVIFDVGANTGQSIALFSRWLEINRIYAFEPAPSSFKKLCLNVKQLARISAHNIGLGAHSETLHITDEFASTVNTVRQKSTTNTVEVDISTVDKFSSENGISHIDFLKIDTEGHDLEVLKGASAMLKNEELHLLKLRLDYRQQTTFTNP